MLRFCYVVWITGTFDQLQPNERGILVHARQIIRRAIRYGRQSDPVWTSQRRIQTLAAMACQGKRFSNENTLIPPCTPPFFFFFVKETNCYIFLTTDWSLFFFLLCLTAWPSGKRGFRKAHGSLDGTEWIHGEENQEFSGQVLFASRTGDGECQLLVRAETFAKRPALTETGGDPWAGEFVTIPNITVSIRTRYRTISDEQFERIEKLRKTNINY